MRGFAVLALWICVSLSAFAQEQGATYRLTENLTIQALGKGVYVHTTYRDFVGYPRFPSNGLIVVSDGEALLVDTAWGEAETDTLVAWVEAVLDMPIARAVVTHAHDDRMDGMSVLKQRDIVTYALPQTTALGQQQRWPSPDSALAGVTVLPVGTRTVEAFFPGPGHTTDNVVVWLPDEKLLFGGCLIRPASSRSLGSTTDAVLGEWATSVRRLKTRYPEAATVVPSHGALGGQNLLDHTIYLLTRPFKPQPGG